MIPAVDTLAPSRWSATAVMTALALTAVLSGTLHAQQLPAELEAELQGKTVFSDGTLLRHASVDAAQAAEIASLLGIGRQRIETFFGEPFPEPFTVTLAPDRDSFSAVLRAEWGVPETACWMVATGVADFMVILSPRVWEKQACEHDPSDKQHVQDIVTHELAHVFHGQRNPTRDFSGAEEIGWYAEGLAVLVADQLNRDRLSDPAQAVASGAAPTLGLHRRLHRPPVRSSDHAPAAVRNDSGGAALGAGHCRGSSADGLEELAERIRGWLTRQG
jgi:hypothetical protein